MEKLLLLRYTLQGIAFVSFVALIANLSYPPGQENVIVQWFSRLDPWLLLSQLRWQQSFPIWSWLPLATVAATLLWGRIFCGWFCPFGALLAFTDKMGRAIFKKLPYRDKVLHAVQPIQGYWLLFLIIIFILGSNWVFFFTPFALFSHEIVRGLTGHIPWILFGIMAGTLVFSRIWCSVLCPTGVLLSLVAKAALFRYRIEENCIYCEKCTKICSVGIAPKSSAAREVCLVCGDCQRACPTKAIQWKSKVGRGKEGFACDYDAAVTKRQESRRKFFKVTFTVLAAAALWKKTVLEAGRKVLRPPGAMPQTSFTAVCNRCGRCVKACPGKALQPMPITEGLGNFETPYIIPRKTRCDLCLTCQQVCPTGAIAEVPLEKVRMGQAVIEKPRCIAWNEGRLCFICGEQCPVLAIDGDEEHRPSVQADKCVGCGSCENACPIDGEAAIRVVPN